MVCFGCTTVNTLHKGDKNNKSSAYSRAILEKVMVTQLLRLPEFYGALQIHYSVP